MKISRKNAAQLSIAPWTIFVRSAMLCGLLAVAFFGLALKRIDRIPLDGSDLGFEAARAHQWMTTLSKNYPYRLPWHENRKKAGNWIENELRKLGYAPQEMIFSEVIAGKQYTDLRNIYAEKKGTTHPDEIILAVAHYDTADTTVEGAMDDASGVAVVLELARVFSKLETRRTVIFLLTDSEEFGAFWGARTFARSFDRADKIIAALNFDFVAAGRQVAILTLNDGLKTGYTPLWLREMALDSLRSVSTSGKTRAFEVRDFLNIVEFTQRAMLIPAADHGAFLEMGIPAFNWVGQNENFAHQMAHYHHTPNDRADALEVESFAQYGLSAERLLRSLNALPRVPENFRSSSYWKITSSLYIDGWGVVILQILAFVPFLLYSFSKFGATLQNHSPTLIRRVSLNEAKSIGILLGSFLIGYAIMRLLPALKIVAQYEAFPATQKSEILYNPNYLAILIVIGVGALAYWIIGRTFREKDDDSDHREIRHAVHAVALAALIILALLGNSYLATLLLLPPAYFWTAVRTGDGPPNRLLNFLLLLGGALTFLVMIIVMTTVFHVGVAYWYMFLAASYGLISVYSVVLFLIAVTIMIRLFRSFVIRA